MELLLLIAAARRSGAETVTAVVPYFGYKYNRRGLPISTAYQSRFMWSTPADIAKLLESVGVDKVISVDLQRPGQGHEACFFNGMIPVETISSHNAFITYFKKNFNLKNPIVVVSPTTELFKKARKVRQKIMSIPGAEKVGSAAFITNETENTNGLVKTNASTSLFLGDVKGADVIIVDDIVDTAGSLSILCKRLKREGAKRVFVFASHGLFSKNSMELIDLSPVEKVVVTDSVSLPKQCSKKIVQISIADLLAQVVESECKYITTTGPVTDSPNTHIRADETFSEVEDEEEFEMD